MAALYQLSYSPECGCERYRSAVRDQTRPRPAVSARRVESMRHPFRSVSTWRRQHSPSHIGVRAEAAVASALVRAGRSVFLPVFAPHERVDLVYLYGSRLVRVQCKSARCSATCCDSAHAATRGTCRAGTRERSDQFGVDSPDTGLVYLVPVDGLPTRLCHIRLAETRNGQLAGLRWAKNDQLGPP